MKRKLSLLLAVVMILGSFSFAFADDDFDPALFLEEQGVLTGDTTGDLMLDQPLERRNAVIMLSRLLGEEDEAKVFEAEGLPTYTDNNDPFYDGYLAWAEVNEYFEGYPDGTFRPREDILVQEYALVLLRALGYGDTPWNEVMDKVEELGLFEGVELEANDAILRGDMAVVTVKALKTAINGSEETLADKLEIEFPEPEELEVVDVYADNLKEVVVEFNKAVDIDTVTDANVKVKDNKGSAVASEDGMSVVITMNDGLTNQKEYTLIVENVESTDGVVIAKTEKTFKPFDATLPEVNKVVVTGPRSFELVFSEPIEKAGKVEIKLDKTILGNRATVNDTNRVAVDVFTNLSEDKEYEVTVTGFEDFAGYKNVVDTLTFTYVKDETPPVATVVKVEQEYVIVDFNKPVKGIGQEDFYHTFNAWTSLGVYKDADMKDENEVKPADSVTRVYVKFNEANNKDSRPLPEGDVRFGIFGKNIKDNWGNALGEVEFTISVVADKAAPEVTLEVIGEDKIKATFNKAVKTLTVKDNIEILDEDGDKISGVKVSEDGKEYTITLPKAMAGEVITVILKEVVDTTVSANKMPLYTEVIEITDKTAPEVTKVYYDEAPRGSDGKFVSANLYVIFDEEVDGETALVATNYSLVDDNAVTILSKTPYFDLNSARVVIPLTEKEYDIAKKAGVKLQVINVKDLVGNTIVPILNGITGELADKTNELEAKDVDAVATDKIKFVIEDLVSNVDKDQFILKIDGTRTKDFEINLTQSGNKTTFEFVTGEEVISSAANNVTLEYSPEPDKGMKNSFGEEVTAITIGDIADKIVPTFEISAITTGTTGNTVTIEFSEDLATMGALEPVWRDQVTVTVDGDEVDVVEVQQDPSNKSELVIVLKADVAIEDTTTVEVTITESKWITDASENANKVATATDSNTAKKIADANE